jgi:hypothetical protein
MDIELANKDSKCCISDRKTSNTRKVPDSVFDLHWSLPQCTCSRSPLQQPTFVQRFPSSRHSSTASIMKVVGAFSLASVVWFALMAAASAIPVNDVASRSNTDSFSGLDLTNATASEADTTVAETVTDLAVRAESKNPDVLKSDPRTYILPFHLRIFEGCLGSEPIVLFTYTNGNIVVKDQPLNHHQIVAINHLVRTFSNPLQLGPYDFVKSRVPFTYKKCMWNDEERWRECGECRSQEWTAGPIDCKKSSTKAVSRTKDMDCSFLLAKQVSVGWCLIAMLC